MDKQTIRFIMDKLNYPFYQERDSGYFLPKMSKMKPSTPLKEKDIIELFSLLEKKTVVERITEVITVPEKKPKGWHLRKENRKTTKTE